MSKLFALRSCNNNLMHQALCWRPVSAEQIFHRMLFCECFAEVFVCRCSCGFLVDSLRVDFGVGFDAAFFDDFLGMETAGRATTKNPQKSSKILKNPPKTPHQNPHQIPHRIFASQLSLGLKRFGIVCSGAGPIQLTPHIGRKPVLRVLSATSILSKNSRVWTQNLGKNQLVSANLWILA